MDGKVSGDAPRGDRARVERASGDRIQRLIDGLGNELGLPVSIDDEKFRLQFYSPQQGTLDRVRIESILFRDSPEEAKEWVRSHEVADAHGPTRIPAAEELGLLGRVCTPLTHQDAILGNLCVIDADARLDEMGFEAVQRYAVAIAPLLDSRRFFDRLDRQAERDELIDLVDPRSELRERGAAALTPVDRADVAVARVLVVRVLPNGRTTAETAGGDGTAVELGLEIALEQSRGLLPADHLRFFRRGTEAVVLLTGATAEQAEQSGGVSERLLAAVRRGLVASRVVVGVGRRVSGLEAVLNSYLDARDAAEIGTRDPARPAVLSSLWLGAHRALLAFPPAMLQQFAADVLGPLQRHREADLLLSTLEAFLVHGGVVPAVTDRPALHRSSVYGRLRRIEEILGVDLSDGEVRLALHHGLVAFRLAGSDGETRQTYRRAAKPPYDRRVYGEGEAGMLSMVGVTPIWNRGRLLAATQVDGMDAPKTLEAPAQPAVDLEVL